MTLKPWRRMGLWALIVSGTLFGCSNRAEPSSDQELGLTARDGHFFRQGKVYRGVGVNYFELFLRRLDKPSDTTSLAGLAELSHRGVPFVRFAACGFNAQQCKLYMENPEAFFARMDPIVRTAEEKGIGLIPVLFWTSCFSQLAGETVDQWGNPQSQTQALARRYTQDLVKRYRNSPAIWAWEYANELNLQVDLPRDPKTDPKPVWTSKAMVTALSDFGTTIRALDPHRALLAGHSHPRAHAWHNTAEGKWKIDTKAQTLEILQRDNPAPLDTLSIHVYGEDKVQSDLGAWAKTPRDYLIAVKALAQQMGRPLWVGEFGMPRGETPEKIQSIYRQQIADLEAAQVDLAAVWVFDLPNQEKTWNVSFTNDRAYMLDEAIAAHRRWTAGLGQP